MVVIKRVLVMKVILTSYDNFDGGHAPDHDNNFGQVVVDLDCGDQEDVGHEGDPNKL